MALVQVNVEESNFRYYFDTISRKRMVSVTKCLSILAMGAAFYSWLKKYGEESDTIMVMAQESGTKLHGIIEAWIKGACIPEDLDLWYFNSTVELSQPELDKLKGFINFNNEFKPNYLETEITLAIPSIKVAGTIDIICEIEGVIYIVDIKTGSGLHHNNELQIAFYEKAYQKHYKTTNTKRALLHLKDSTKKCYQFKVIDKPLEHDYVGFLHARGLWYWDNPKHSRFLAENEPVSEVVSA